MKAINGNKVYEFRGDEEEVWVSAPDRPAAEALFAPMQDDYFDLGESVECVELDDDDMYMKFEAEDGKMTTFAEFLAGDPEPGFICTTSW